MIPTRNAPRYKIILRTRLDVFNNIQKKCLYKKKWRIWRKARSRRRSTKLKSFDITSLSKRPNRYRYYFQKTLLYKQSIKMFYGWLQDYKFKAIVRTCTKWGAAAFIHKIERQLIYLLQRLNLTKTTKESKYFLEHHQVYLNGKVNKKSVSAGEVLHFTPKLKKLFRKRFIKSSKIILPSYIDLDVANFHFIFFSDWKSSKFPFNLHFKRIWRWYSI